MKAYEPFNKTLTQRIKNFYEENRNKIKDGLYIALTLGILGSGIAYYNYRNNKETQKSMNVLEAVFEEEKQNPSFGLPDSEREYLESKFNRVYNKKYSKKK